MIKRLLFSKFSGLLFLTYLLVSHAFALVKTFAPVTNIGLWSVPANWSPANVPLSTDDVLIPAGKTCLVDVAVTRTGPMTIFSGGVLDVNQDFQQNGSAAIVVQPGGIFDVRGVKLTLQSPVFTGTITVDATTDLYFSAAVPGTLMPALSQPDIKDFYLTTSSDVNLSGNVRVNGQMAVGFGSVLHVLSHRLAIRSFAFSPGTVEYTPGPSGSELELFGNASFNFAGASVKSLICSTTGTVTLTGGTTLGSELYIETGCTFSPNFGVGLAPFGSGFTLTNKGTFNPSATTFSLNTGNGLLDNRGAFYHGGGHTFHSVNNAGVYRIQNPHSLTVSNSFVNSGQFNPDNNNPLVNITIVGANTLENSGVFKARAATTLNLASSAVFGLLNQPGALFQFEGTANCQNGIRNVGNFEASAGTVNLTGASVEVQASAPMTVGRLNSSGTVLFTGNNPVNLTDALTVSAGTLDLGGKSLVLKSSQTKTARIAPIIGVLANANNVTQERFVNGAAGGWYFTGTCLSDQSFSDWTDDYHIRGPFPEASINLSGDHSSVFIFDGESAPTGTNSNVEVNGWRIPTTADITPGKGYRTNIPAKFFTGNKTIDNTGTLVQGAFNFNPQYNATGYDGGGWNFLANPYPSTLDWNSAGWTKTSLNGAIYVYNGVTGQYGAYAPLGGHVAGNTYLGTNGVTSMIASGQAFFVKANAPSPGLTATESVKASANGSFIRSAVESTPSSFRISLANSDNYTDENIIRFDDGATTEFDGQMDAIKMSGAVQNLSSLTSDGVKLCVNTLPYFNSDGYVLPLSVSVYQPGEYRLSFTEFEEKARLMTLLLHDKHLHQVQALFDNYVYPFSVTSNPASQGSDRFEIIMGIDKGDAAKIQDKKPLLITYPNPSHAGNLNVKLMNARPGETWIRIVDAMGKHIVDKPMDALTNYDFTMPGRLMPGVYFVEVKTGHDLLKTKVLVKD